MRKFILVAATVATLAVPAVASADSTMVINPDSPAGEATATLGDEAGLASFDGSAMGFYNSRVTGNGSYISDQAHTLKALGTPGRGAAVQDTLGHTK